MLPSIPSDLGDFSIDYLGTSSYNWYFSAIKDATRSMVLISLQPLAESGQKEQSSRSPRAVEDSILASNRNTKPRKCLRTTEFCRGDSKNKRGMSFQSSAEKHTLFVYTHSISKPRRCTFGASKITPPFREGTCSDPGVHRSWWLYQTSSSMRFQTGLPPSDKDSNQDIVLLCEATKNYMSAPFCELISSLISWSATSGNVAPASCRAGKKWHGPKIPCLGR